MAKEALLVTELISSSGGHAGAGTTLIENALAPAELRRLDELRRSLPLTAYRPTAHRRFYKDDDGWLTALVLRTLEAALGRRYENGLPWYRFIECVLGGPELFSGRSRRRPHTCLPTNAPTPPNCHGGAVGRFAPRAGSLTGWAGSLIGWAVG